LTNTADLFSSGNILHVENYDFRNSIPTKDKYLIVLYLSSDLAVFIHSLTTSQIRVPANKIQHGCTKSKDLGLSYYMFEKDRTIGDINEFSFPKNTFVFFQSNVRKNKVSKFNKYLNNDQIRLIDRLVFPEYKRLLKCAARSFFTPRFIKRILEEEILQLNEDLY